MSKDLKYELDINSEKEIDNTIISIEWEYEKTNCLENYVRNILEVAISIVDIFPYKALKLLNDINETYSIVGSVPAESLDLAVDIVCSIAKKEDIKKSLEYLNIIEVDYFKLEALEKLVLMSKSQKLTDTLNKIIKELEANIS